MNAKETLTSWLETGDTQRVLKGLAFVCKKGNDKDIASNISFQSGRYKELQDQQNKNTISQSEYQLESAKIRAALLRLIESLPEYWSDEDLDTIVSNIQLGSKLNIKILTAITISAIIILTIIVKFTGSNAKDTPPPLQNPMSFIKSTDSISPIEFNVVKKSDSLSLVIKLESLRLKHDFVTSNKISVLQLKKAIIYHYKIYEILQSRGEQFNEIYLMADNKNLEEESKTLLQSGVKNGDIIRVIPVYYRPPMSLPKTDADETNIIEIFITCDSVLKYVLINNEQYSLKKLNDKEYYGYARLKINRCVFEIPESGVSEVRTIHGDEKIHLYCR